MSQQSKPAPAPVDPQHALERKEKASEHTTELVDAAVGGAAGAAAGVLAGPIGMAIGAATGAAIGAILGHRLSEEEHAHERAIKQLDEIDAEEEFFGAPRSLGSDGVTEAAASVIAEPPRPAK